MFVHSDPIARRHYAPAVSSTTFGLLIIYGALFLSPFFLALFTQGFWLSVSSIFVRPSVSTTGQCVVFLTTSSGAVRTWQVDGSSQLGTGTGELNDVDEDGDGVNEYLSLSLTVPVSDVVHVRIVPQLQYYIDNVDFIFNLSSTPLVDVSFPVGSESVTVSSLLQLRQPDLIESNQHSIYLSYEYDWSTLLQLSKISNDIETSITQPHLTAESQSSWTPGSSNSFSLTLKLHYSSLVVHVKPSWGQKLKWGWIQYYPLYALFTIVLVPFISIVLRSQTLPTIVKQDAVEMKSKVGVKFKPHYF